MLNVDKPAYPQDFDTKKAIEKGYWYEWNGLTKLEAASIRIAAGLRSNPEFVAEGPEEIADYAVNDALAIFSKLENMEG